MKHTSKFWKTIMEPYAGIDEDQDYKRERAAKWDGLDYSQKNE